MEATSAPPTTRELLRAIKEHCLSCSNGSKKEVEECFIPECNLYKYRLGNPCKIITKQTK